MVSKNIFSYSVIIVDRLREEVSYPNEAENGIPRITRNLSLFAHGYMLRNDIRKSSFVPVNIDQE